MENDIHKLAVIIQYIYPDDGYANARKTAAILLTEFEKIQINNRAAQGAWSSDRFDYPSICNGAEIICSKDVPITQEDSDLICMAVNKHRIY